MPAEGHENILGRLLIELSPRISHLARHALRKLDPPLSYTQYRVLLLISEGRSTLSGLRAATTVSLSTLSEVVDGLAKRDLLIRTPSTRDRRSTELSLTDLGQRALEDGTAQLQGLGERLVATLPQAAQPWLAETLGPVNASAMQELAVQHGQADDNEN